MKKDYIDIDGYWAFLLCYNISWWDLDDVASVLEAFGYSERGIRKVCRVLMEGNTGFTLSLPSERMSVMFIGNASTPSQWLDTVSHEIDHLQDTILRYYGVSHGTEDAAYLQGEITRLISEKLGCRIVCSK